MKHHGWDFNCPADLSESALLALIIGAKIAEDVIPEPLKGRIKIAVDEILKGNNPDFLDTTLINSLLVFAESGATDISAIFPRPFFYFPEKFSPPQNGEFFESQKEEHFHFSKNSPGETGTSFCLKKEFEHRENGRKEIRTSDLYS